MSFPRTTFRAVRGGFSWRVWRDQPGGGSGYVVDSRKVTVTWPSPTMAREEAARLEWEAMPTFLVWAGPDPGDDEGELVRAPSPEEAALAQAQRWSEEAAWPPGEHDMLVRWEGGERVVRVQARIVIEPVT